MTEQDELTRARNVQKILGRLQEQLRDRYAGTPAKEPANRAILLRLALKIEALSRAQEREIAELEAQKEAR